MSVAGKTGLNEPQQNETILGEHDSCVYFIPQRNTSFDSGEP